MESTSAVSETATPKQPRKGNGAAARATDTAEANRESPAPSATAPAPEAASLNVLTSALGLMMASPRHRHLFLADLEWALLPPLALKQFRLFTKDGRPVAFATWAFVSDEAAARLEAGAGKLKPNEWKSGDQCWLVDLVAPFGEGRSLARSLKKEVLSEEAVQMLERDPETGRLKAAVLEPEQDRTFAGAQ